MSQWDNYKGCGVNFDLSTRGTIKLDKKGPGGQVWVSGAQVSGNDLEQYRQEGQSANMALVAYAQGQLLNSPGIVRHESRNGKPLEKLVFINGTPVDGQ